MAIELYEHNKIAYEKVVVMLKSCGEVAVVHPTGTDKTYIAFKLCEDNPDKKVLWLSPSEYIFKTQPDNVKSKAACPEISSFTLTPNSYISQTKR